MTTPSRTELIHLHWLNELTLGQIGERYDVPYWTVECWFKRHGVLRRVMNSERINRMRLELMLFPAVWEYERERLKCLKLTG